MKPQAITHLALRYTLCVGSALLALSTMSAAQTLSAEQAGSMSGARPSGQVEDQDDGSSERIQNARKQAAQRSSEQGSSSSSSERAQNARKQAAQRYRSFPPLCKRCTLSLAITSRTTTMARPCLLERGAVPRICWETLTTR